MHARSACRRFATLLISIDDRNLGSLVDRAASRSRRPRAPIGDGESLSIAPQAFHADRPARDGSAHRDRASRRRLGPGPDRARSSG